MKLQADHNRLVAQLAEAERLLAEEQAAKAAEAAAKKLEATGKAAAEKNLREVTGSLNGIVQAMRAGQHAQHVASNKLQVAEQLASAQLRALEHAGPQQAS